MTQSLPFPGQARHPVRWAGVAVLALIVLTPLALVVYQSFLAGPFFFPDTEFSLNAYRFVFANPEFYRALRNSLLIAGGMVLIAVPCGSALAFLVTRTDLPGRRSLETLILLPMFVSSIVFAFGYVVSVGPVGFLSLFVKGMLGYVPWKLYSIWSIIVIAGFTHVPHVYLYVSSSLRNVNPEVEEAARVCGAGIWRTASSVSIPLVLPALIFSGMLMFLVGIELFGLILILGGSGREHVLTSYLYRLTNIYGRPSYELMAVVTLVIVGITGPLVLLQRMLLRSAARYATIRGHGAPSRPLPLGMWRWVAFAAVMLWMAFTIVLPIGGILVRSLVSSWGVGVNILDVLTFANFEKLLSTPNLLRAIVNTFLLASVGGAFAVAVYAAFALVAHRWQSRGAVILDFLVLIPRALPGIIAGLLFLWIFLFIPGLAPVRSTLAGLWIAYTVIALAYGMRIITSSLTQISPDLEDAARVAGASPARSMRDVTLPLLRFGLVNAWILIFISFCREYSTGVYLVTPDTQVIGALLVSLYVGGEIRVIAALSVVNVLLIGIGVLLALRFGGRLHA